MEIKTVNSLQEARQMQQKGWKLVATRGGTFENPSEWVMQGVVQSEAPQTDHSAGKAGEEE